MTLSEIIKDKLNRLNSVPDEFVTAVEKNNIKVFTETLKLIEQLEREDGKIIVSQKNLQLSAQITNQLSTVVFDTEYLNAVKSFASEFNTQAKLNQDYFKKAFGSFTNEDLFQSVLKQSQVNAIELLSEDAVKQQFVNPLKDILNGSITGGGKFSDLVKSLDNFIIGSNQKGGALTINAKNVAYDSFAFSDRQYTKTISETIGAEWYKYSGGELPDSRPFCVEYHNQFFHKKEVENFGRGIDIDGSELTDAELQGRYPDTNAATIFTFAGGYNCKHSWLPVSISSVPPSVINRNIVKGYYKP